MSDFTKTSTDASPQIQFGGTVSGIECNAVLPISQGLLWDIYMASAENHRRAFLAALGVSLVSPKMPRFEASGYSVGRYAERVAAKLPELGIDYLDAVNAGAVIFAEIADVLIDSDDIEDASGN